MGKYEMTNEQGNDSCYDFIRDSNEEINGKTIWEEIEENKEVYIEHLLREMKELREQRDMWRFELAKRISAEKGDDKLRAENERLKSDNECLRLENEELEREIRSTEELNDTLFEQAEKSASARASGLFCVGVTAGVSMTVFLIYALETISRLF